MTDCCRDCKFWDNVTPHERWAMRVRVKPAPNVDRYGDEHEQQETEAGKRFGMCRAIEPIDPAEGADPNAIPLAFTQDASNYQSWLYTQADFGCVLATAKEPA